ncbi:MAG: AMIN domain-containing protein [Acidobacteria bacterium]|nr:AMIN domain-containing protein [Acidobacteriota bacterium]
MTAKAGSFKRPVLLIALLLGGGVSTTAEDQLAVTAVRYWSLADVTRIAVEVSGPFTYRMDRLSSPDRAFFDLKETRQLLTRKGMYTVPVGDPRVRQVRVAEPQPSITRVVLDLEDGPLEVVASQLSVPDRLVIEVRAKGEVPPATTLSKSGVEKIEERPVQASDKPSEKPAPPAPRLETAPAENVARESPKPADPAAVARPARRNSNGERSMTRVLGLKLRRVVLDPGHGGQDHGSTGPGGVVEKELVLDVTRRLGALV